MTRTKDEIEKIVNDLGYILLDEYMDLNKRRVFIEDEWGYRYDVFLGHLMGGQIPSLTSPNRPNLSLENISLWLLREEKTLELCEENEYKGNSKKLWFHCLVAECGENFDTSWSDMYSKGGGCPYCSRQRVSDRNRLSIIRPDISSEWDRELNEDTPNDVSYVSGKRRWWICPKGHESYPATIAHRKNGRGCPRCSGNIVSDDNRLSILFPRIAEEWDYKLNEGTPYDFSYGSTKNKYWKCPKGHKSYPTTINNRVSGGTGCPRCANEQKESLIATELKRWCKETFKDVDIEHKMFRNPETDYWLKCDIYLGGEETIDGVYIEVHGPQHFKLNGWHKQLANKNGKSPEEEFEYQKNLDKIKKKYAQKNGFYIEVDLRKIKTVEQAIEYVEKIINSMR